MAKVMSQFLTAGLVIAFMASLNARSSEKIYSDTSPAPRISTVKSVPDQQNRVHSAGSFWLTVTNTGYFGNPISLKDPCTGNQASSAEFPAGTGTEYMYFGGLIFGGYLSADNVPSLNDATVFQGPLVTTAYEGWTGEGGVDDMPKELWPAAFTDDPDGTSIGDIEESSYREGKYNCFFEDVYDPKATADEQYSTMFTDKYVNRIFTGMDDHDHREHFPLGLEIRQKTYAWDYDYAKKFIIADITVYNRNADGKDIYDLFAGISIDNDVGIGAAAPSLEYFGDDICGFISNWDGYIDPATGEKRNVELNLAWAADNDGREYSGYYYDGSMHESVAGTPLNGAKGVFGVHLLKNPAADQKHSFNVYFANSIDESFDWGPRWQTGLHPRPVTDHAAALPHERRDDPGSRPWLFDLTPEQKGYDDYNQDSLSNYASQEYYGGRTEGRPIGDKGKYMVMSNGEFDYNTTSIREVHLGVYADPNGTEPQYAQAYNWQRWTVPELLGEPGYADDIPDGTIQQLNDFANGRDVRYIMSFGPLGYETSVNVAYDNDGDGTPDSSINGKKAWKFAHGDSLNFTLAFVLSDDFHTSTDQSPLYENEGIVDLTDGLQNDLYDKGWYDALYNILWVKKLYDTPMYDTPVIKNGITMGDGWYGEDVGIDGIFAPYNGSGYCWWLDTDYIGPDEGENDQKLTIFTSPVTDIYGITATNEDQLLPYGRETAGTDCGTTAEFGRMEAYPVAGGYIPQGTPVRYGYGNNRLDAGDGVPDMKGPPPPASPKIKVSFVENDVLVEWSSHEIYSLPGGGENYSGPEHIADTFSGFKDFEAYTVKVSPNSDPNNFIDLLTVDLNDYIYESVAFPGEYLDIPVNKTIYDSLVTAGQTIISTIGKTWHLKPYGNNRDLRTASTEPGVFEYKAVKSVVPFNGSELEKWDYSIRLFDKYLKDISFISVVSSDFGDPAKGVYAQTSSLKTNMKKVKFNPEDEDIIPLETKLYQNYPNPFNPDTKISFSIAEKTKVELSIFNTAGQLVRTLVKAEMEPGQHSAVFNADDLNSGVYFCTLKTGAEKFTKKMIMLK